MVPTKESNRSPPTRPWSGNRLFEHNPGQGGIQPVGLRGGEDGGMEGGGVLSSGLEWWERYTGHAGTSTWEETRNKTNSVQNIWH